MDEDLVGDICRVLHYLSCFSKLASRIDLLQLTTHPPPVGGVRKVMVDLAFWDDFFERDRSRDDFRTTTSGILGTHQNFRNPSLPKCFETVSEVPTPNSTLQSKGFFTHYELGDTLDTNECGYNTKMFRNQHAFRNSVFCIPWGGDSPPTKNCVSPPRGRWALINVDVDEEVVGDMCRVLHYL